MIVVAQRWEQVVDDELQTESELLQVSVPLTAAFTQSHSQADVLQIHAVLRHRKRKIIIKYIFVKKPHLWTHHGFTLWWRKHFTSPERLLIKSCSMEMVCDKMSTKRANKLSLALSAIGTVDLLELVLFLSLLLEWSSCKSLRASVWCFREPISPIQ